MGKAERPRRSATFQYLNGIGSLLAFDSLNCVRWLLLSATRNLSRTRLSATSPSLTDLSICSIEIWIIFDIFEILEFSEFLTIVTGTHCCGWRSYQTQCQKNQEQNCTLDQSGLASVEAAVSIRCNTSTCTGTKNDIYHQYENNYFSCCYARDSFANRVTIDEAAANRTHMRQQIARTTCTTLGMNHVKLFINGGTLINYPPKSTM